MSEPLIYEARQNYCGCHPETCCCRPYAVMLGDEVIDTHHDKQQAIKKAAFYNEVGRHE